LYGQRFSHVPSRFLQEIPDEETRYIGGDVEVKSRGGSGSRVSSGGGNWKDFLE
jgi:hypothetical protein